MQGAAAKPAAERAVDCRIAEREQHAAFARGCRLQRGKLPAQLLHAHCRFLGRRRL